MWGVNAHIFPQCTLPQRSITYGWGVPSVTLCHSVGDSGMTFWERLHVIHHHHLVLECEASLVYCHRF